MVSALNLSLNQDPLWPHFNLVTSTKTLSSKAVSHTWAPGVRGKMYLLVGSVAPAPAWEQAPTVLFSCLSLQSRWTLPLSDHDLRLPSRMFMAKCQSLWCSQHVCPQAGVSCPAGMCGVPGQWPAPTTAKSIPCVGCQDEGHGRRDQCMLGEGRLDSPALVVVVSGEERWHRKSMGAGQAWPAVASQAGAAQPVETGRHRAPRHKGHLVSLQRDVSHTASSIPGSGSSLLTHHQACWRHFQ